MTPPLKIENLTVRANRCTILSQVSLALRPGDFVGIIGPNGAGKTTLLRAVLGLCEATSGDVHLDGRALGRLSARERAALVAWLPQQALSSEALLVLELVVAARFRFRESHAESKTAAMRILEEVGAGSWSHRRLGELSGGERQRIAIAALLAQEAPLLLLDEPANHLDPRRQIEIYRLIGALRRSGKSIVCVTHDVNLLRHAVDPPGEDLRVVGMSAGRTLFDTALSHSGLHEKLTDLYRIPFHRVDTEAGSFLVPAPGPGEPAR